MPESAHGQAVCARVRIQIVQEAVLTRSAFDAMLSLINDEANPDSLEAVRVTLRIQDDDGNDVTSFFGIAPPEMTNISDMDGTGVVPPGTTATGHWLIIPSDEAAPGDEPVRYNVTGELSYSQRGQITSIPLYPSSITVYPDARLFFKYFLQSPIYSDNPFTTHIVEPAEPYNLGLMVHNAGNGTARNFRITSAQPQIVENEKDLLISFQITGSQLWKYNPDGMLVMPPVSPSLRLDFGDIPPHSVAIARWIMTTSLQGRFISYDAWYEHKTGLGDPRLSLIEDVRVCEMNHVVSLGDDGLPDFLVNAKSDIDDDCPSASGLDVDDEIPDCIYTSSGGRINLRKGTVATTDGPPSLSDLIVELVASVPQAGWNYVQLNDPARGAFRLVRVERLDSMGATIREITAGAPGDVCNAWTTHRWQPRTSAQRKEDLLHLLDFVEQPGTHRYRLTYEPFLEVASVEINRELAGTLQAASMTQRSNISDVVVTFTESTNLGALIANGSVTSAVTLWQRGLGGLAAQKVILDKTRYRWDPAGYRLIIDLTDDGPGGGNKTMLSDGNYELQLKVSSIKSALLSATLLDSDGKPDGVYRFGDNFDDGDNTKSIDDKFYRLAGDGDGDRAVTQADRALVQASWLQSVGQPGYNPNGDMDSSGTVNLTDLQLVDGNLNATLPFE